MIPISLVDSKKVRFVHTGVEGVRLEPISSLTINRHSLPTAVPVDIRSGFVAEQIDAFKVGASVIPLTDAKDVHNFGILSIREV